MVFSVAQLIAFLSQDATLLPGSPGTLNPKPVNPKPSKAFGVYGSRYLGLGFRPFCDRIPAAARLTRVRMCVPELGA